MFRSRMKNEEATEPVIAVIDDDESVLKSLERLLKAFGFQSVLFRSAEAFLADPQHPGFECLVSDLQLGGMSGIDLQKKLTSAGVNIPIILMTARDDKEFDRLELQSHGATVMRKSDPGEVLLATLNRVVHRFRRLEHDRRDGDKTGC